MTRPNAFVKISGSLLEMTAVLEWLKALAATHFVVICIGGGDQINEAFEANNYPIRYGPLGRITRSLEERQLARNVLERNQAAIQDSLDEMGINARVVIPVEEIGGVLCHINGDVHLLAAYNGYDRLFLLTLKDRLEKKRVWILRVAATFESNAPGPLDKIEVVGF